MRLKECAKIIRSKNSGPFELTIDIFIDDKNMYEKIKMDDRINTELVSSILKIQKNKVKGIYYFDEVKGIKITYLREVSSGSFLDTDVYGTQQYIPFLEIEV